MPRRGRGARPRGCVPRRKGDRDAARGRPGFDHQRRAVGGGCVDVAGSPRRSAAAGRGSAAPGGRPRRSASGRCACPSASARPRRRGARRRCRAGDHAARRGPCVRLGLCGAGRLHLGRRRRTAEASASFERVLAAGGDAGAPCALAPYAALRDAQALLRAGRTDDALARAIALGDEERPTRDESRLVLADARAALGDRAEAVQVWRAILASSPRGLRWADVAVQLASALLDGVDGPARSRAREAPRPAGRAMQIESPWVADKLRPRRDARTRVVAPRKGCGRAAAHAGRTRTPGPTSMGRTRRSRSARPRAPRRSSKPSPRGTKSEGTPRAKPPWSGPKRHPMRQDGRRLDRCHRAVRRRVRRSCGDGALFRRARRARAPTGSDEAIGRFERVEKRFPSHRYADDARFRAAIALSDEGDEGRSIAMLASIADAYPDGDMRGEALFRVALSRVGKQDLDGARAALDRLLAAPAEDRAWGAAGRAEYYRARLAHIAGDTADAKARYAALVAAHPFAFYMLLGYARLTALDEAAARAALETGGRQRAWRALPHARPSRARGARVRTDRALARGRRDRRGTARGGVRGPRGGHGRSRGRLDPRLVSLADRAGAPDLGHGFARARLLDYRAHWPTGRWRLPWRVAFPRAWLDVVGAESASAGVPSALTWAIMREESAFNPDAHSAANAFGLMQLLVGTRRASWPAGRPSRIVDEPALRRPEVLDRAGHAPARDAAIVVRGEPVPRHRGLQWWIRRGPALAGRARDRRLRRLRRAHPLRGDAQLPQAGARQRSRVRLPLRTGDVRRAPRPAGARVGRRGGGRPGALATSARAAWRGSRAAGRPRASRLPVGVRR